MRAWWIAGAALCLGGCADTTQERVRAYNEDGVHLFQHGRYRDARESFEAAAALKPKDPGLLYNLGESCDRTGASARAERYYNDCLDQAPNHAPCRHALAALLVREGRQPEANRMVADWLAHEPKLAAAYAEDGWLLQQAGELPRAQGRLQQALALDPHDRRALTELALVYEAMNRPERALVLYERILERDPHQPDVTRRVNFLLTRNAGRPHPE